MTKKDRPHNPKTPRSETCLNPWRKCARTDIVVSIQYNGKILPICSACWNQIADSNKEW